MDYLLKSDIHYYVKSWFFRHFYNAYIYNYKGLDRCYQQCKQRQNVCVLEIEDAFAYLHDQPAYYNYIQKTYLQYWSKKNGNSIEYKNQDTCQPLLSVKNNERTIKKFY